MEGANEGKPGKTERQKKKKLSSKELWVVSSWSGTKVVGFGKVMGVVTVVWNESCRMERSRHSKLAVLEVCK